MPNLYILGAGFICEIGYPLVNGMYDEFVKFCIYTFRQTHLAKKPLKYIDEIKVIQKYWKKWEKYSKKVEYQFEDFMNDIMRYRKQLIKDAIDIKFINNFFNLPFILYDYFWHTNNNSKKKSFKKLLEKFIEDKLQAGDVIIDFNYDMEVEKILEQKRKAWQYQYNGKNISLIKIHGSITWIKSKPNQIIKWDDGKSITESKVKDKYTRLYKDIYYYHDYFDYLRNKNKWRKSPLPVIIPPVEEHNYIKNSEYGGIFKNIQRELKKVSKIKFNNAFAVGYSFQHKDDMLVPVMKKCKNVHWEMVGHGKRFENNNANGVLKDVLGYFKVNIIHYKLRCDGTKKWLQSLQ